MIKTIHALLLRLAIAALALLSACLGHAQAVPAPGIWSGDELETTVLIDESGRMGFEEATARLEHGEGHKVTDYANFELDAQRIAWVRVALPATDAPVSSVLTLPRIGLDSVSLFTRNADGSWLTQRSGDSIPVAEWPLRHLHTAFPVTLGPQAQVAYIAVRNGVPASLPVRLWDHGSFDDASKLVHLFVGTYAGFIILLVMISAFNAVAWRDAVHLYYAIYVIVVAVTQFATIGFGGEYLWSQNAWWNDLAGVTLGSLSTSLGGIFIWKLTSERGSRLVSGLLWLNVVAGMVVAACFLAFGHARVYLLYNVYVVLSLANYLWTLAWYARRRPASGGWVFAGFLMLFTGVLLVILPNLGVLGLSPTLRYGSQIGGALEIPLVLIGLFMRSRERRDNLMRVRLASRVDPLTGISTHAILKERLSHLLRKPGTGAVIRVQLANAGAIREAFGADGLQLAVLHAGACVARGASEGDTIARHRAGDFVLLLEGMVARSEVEAIAQRIIVRGLTPTHRLPAGLTLNLHVVYAVAPFGADDARQLLDHLGEILDALKDHRGTVMHCAGEPMPRASQPGAVDWRPKGW